MTETKPTYAAGGAVELKPCPFCKSTLLLSTGESGKVTICLDCESSSPIWNTRRAQWVAVSERQPEVLQDVLLITKYKRVIMGYRDQNASGIFITFSANYPINDITHWLPLDWLPLPGTADK